MKTVYSELVREVTENGGRVKFRIDLKRKSLEVKNKKYIEDGQVLVDMPLIDEVEDPWETLDGLWYDFKHSRPERFERKSYFKVPDDVDISIGDLMYGETRSVAQAKLEGFILCAGLVGILEWENPKHWFWQSESDSDFIVLREWVV